MEHRLVTGGAEYLPFARRCVAKLKKLGLSYAGQSFDIGGVSVKVRIEPGHEYIRIDGGTVNIYSGVVKYLANTNISRLINSFRPTTNAWERCMRKSSAELPSAFSTDTFILKDKKTPVDQYRVLAPSMFSGLMAKHVAILMAKGIEVKYDYRWSTCHGVTLDSSGKPWVVEISQGNGVLAKKLSLSLANRKSRIDAERAAYELFGGMSEANEFPSGEKLAAEISEGTVVQLLSSEAMFEYFRCVPHASHIGWSFGQALSVAYNAVAFNTTGVEYEGRLFKLTFLLTEDSKTAILELLESGPLVIKAGDEMPMRFDTPVVSDGPSYAKYYWGDEPDPETPPAPLFVCHLNDEVEIIRLSYSRGVTSGYAYLREIVEGNLPVFGRPSHMPGSGTFLPATPYVKILRIYPSCFAEGSTIKAHSTVGKEEYTFDSLGSFPSAGASYIQYRIRSTTTSAFNEWIWHSYRSRDTLIQFDALASASSQCVQEYGLVYTDGYDEESAVMNGSVTIYETSDTTIISDWDSAPVAGEQSVWLGSDELLPVLKFRKYPPFKIKVFWSSGVESDCTDITPRTITGDWVYTHTEAGSTGVPRFLEEQILASATPDLPRQYVVALFPMTLFSDGLLDQQDLPDDPHPRIQYTFIGASGTYLTPAG